MGHGHVIPNKDGSKARCGGPALCAICSWEEERLAAADIQAKEDSENDLIIDKKLTLSSQEFRGLSVEKATDHANQFNWDDKKIVSVETMNRSGTFIIRVWFTEFK